MVSSWSPWNSVDQFYLKAPSKHLKINTSSFVHGETEKLHHRYRILQRSLVKGRMSSTVWEASLKYFLEEKTRSKSWSGQRLTSISQHMMGSPISWRSVAVTDGCKDTNTAAIHRTRYTHLVGMFWYLWSLAVNLLHLKQGEAALYSSETCCSRKWVHKSDYYRTKPYMAFLYCHLNRFGGIWGQRSSHKRFYSCCISILSIAADWLCKAGWAVCQELLLCIKLNW